MALAPKKGDTGSDANIDDVSSDDNDLNGLTGDLKCNTKFWKCIGGVVKSGAHYLQEPGGLSK